VRSNATGAGPGPRQIFVTRHAEKPAAGDGAVPATLGVDAIGTPNPHTLTPRGWTRAGAQTVLFAPQDQRFRDGFAQPTMLVAPDYGSPAEGAVHRPVQTLVPLSARLGVAVSTPTPKGQEPELVGRHLLTATDQVVLVSWDHENIPELVAALLGAAEVSPGPQLPADGWPDDCYDVVLSFTRQPGAGGLRYRFSELPQLLLDGDSAVPLGRRRPKMA